MTTNKPTIMFPPILKGINPPKNNKPVIILINKIAPYSAKAIKAKPNPPNSTLYPATNSDSPSTKSNGARLVSAKTVINQINIASKHTKIKEKPISRYKNNSNLLKKSKEHIITVDIISSYEILCATARILPNSPY